MFICRLIYYFKQFPSKPLFRGVQGTLFLVPMVSPECRFHSTDFPSLSYASAIVESLPRLVGENLNLDCLQLSLFALTASCFSVWCDGGPSSCSTLRSYDTENLLNNFPPPPLPAINNDRGPLTRGTLGGTQCRNTVRKIGKYRNTVLKFDEIPIPQL